MSIEVTVAQSEEQVLVRLLSLDPKVGMQRGRSSPLKVECLLLGRWTFLIRFDLLL